MMEDIVVNPDRYVNNENENIKRGGQHVWISWTNTPILGNDGKVKEILSIGNDITLLKRSHLEFLGVISNKLRTSVVFIKQASAMLQQEKFGGLQEKQKPFVNCIVEESGKLEKMIANLLNFASLSDHNISSSKEAVKLADFIPASVEPLISAVKNKPVDLVLDIPDKCLAVNINSVYFEIAVDNLIENMIKFNDKTRIGIKISAKKENEEILISFSDNGAGIPLDEQKRILAEIYHPEMTLTGNVSGKGLGLALVKKIITASGGSVSIISEIGKGTTFTIKLR
jgi:two-component system phosphate regulon sensor histidine kinase PhoR